MMNRLEDRSCWCAPLIDVEEVEKVCLEAGGRQREWELMRGCWWFLQLSCRPPRAVS